MDGKLTKEYQALIDSKKVILLTIAGSHLLGLNTKHSDRDEVGIYIETMPEVVGFSGADQVEWRSAEIRTGKADEPSKAGDVDLMLYGLRKFVRLALGGNPSIVNLFFAPQGLIHSPFATELQELAPLLWNRQTIKAFLGYMNQQRLRLIGERGQKRVNRPGLEAQYGYDTKYATHMIRLGLQGTELLTTKRLTLPLGLETQTYLKQLRDGEVSYESCLDYAEIIENRMKHLLDTTLELPGGPDIGRMESWMLSVYRRAWELKW
jgi:predicted nucleotidyltransferase